MKTKIEELKKLLDDLYYSADLKFEQCEKFQKYLDDIGQEMKTKTDKLNEIKNYLEKGDWVFAGSIIDDKIAESISI